MVRARILERGLDFWMTSWLKVPARCKHCCINLQSQVPLRLHTTLDFRLQIEEQNGYTESRNIRCDGKEYHFTVDEKLPKIPE